ncbi:hypothetical protein EDB84DRAFT_1506785 [Lactarius hengduanensis]|nr:hypothetical protein EDB84DRAFT_1506785 [Lactarius hengduanensis]
MRTQVCTLIKPSTILICLPPYMPYDSRTHMHQHVLSTSQAGGYAQVSWPHYTVYTVSWARWTRSRRRTRVNALMSKPSASTELTNGVCTARPVTGDRRPRQLELPGIAHRRRRPARPACSFKLSVVVSGTGAVLLVVGMLSSVIPATVWKQPLRVL